MPLSTNMEIRVVRLANGGEVGCWMRSGWIFLSFFDLAVQTLLIIPAKRKLREKEEDEDMCDYPSSMDEKHVLISLKHGDKQGYLTRSLKSINLNPDSLKKHR